MTTLTDEEYINKLDTYFKKFSKNYLGSLLAKPKTKAGKKDGQAKKKPTTYRFYHDKSNNALVYSYKAKSGLSFNSIYLPYIVNINDLLNKIRDAINNVKHNYEETDTKFTLYKDLLVLNTELKNIKRSIILNLDISHSKYLLEENRLLKSIASFSDISSDNKNDYFSFGHQLGSFKLNDFLDNTRVRCLNGGKYNDNEIGYVMSKTDKTATLKMVDGSTKNVDLKMIEPFSVTDSINEIKKNGYMFNLHLSKILSQITNSKLLLTILRIETTLDDINKRPYYTTPENLEDLSNKKLLKLIKPYTNIINNPFFNTLSKKLLYNSKSRLYLGVDIVRRHPVDTDDYNTYKFTDKNWRMILSYYDDTRPFKIDDFTFKSIYHYHVASIFYNRTDLTYENRMKYNEIFLQFTHECTGSIKFADREPAIIKRYLSTLNYNLPIDWETSISQKYLIKAYYAKALCDVTFRSCLLSTGVSALIEKINTKKVLNNELMCVRYYLQNNIKPLVSNFNYTSIIKTNFDRSQRENVISNPEKLMDVLIKNDVYKEYSNFLDNYDQLLDDYFKIDNSGKMSREYLIEQLNTLIFNYNSLYIFDSIQSYLDNDKIHNKNITHYKSINNFADDELWIVNFLYNYCVEYAQKQLEYQLERQHELNRSIQEIHNTKINAIRLQYNTLRSILATYGYNLVDVPMVKNSIFISLVNMLNRNHIYPFNFNNKYDKREKVNSTQEMEKNFFDDIEYPVYMEAVNVLQTMVHSFYSDKGGEITDTEQILKAVSRILGVNIRIISNNGNKEYLFSDIRSEYTDLPTIHPLTKDHLEPLGVLTMGQLSETVFYFPTRPNLNNAIETENYFMEVKHGYLIKETNGKHSIISRVDLQTMTLKSANIKFSDFNGKNIEVDNVQRILTRSPNGNLVYYFAEKEELP
jgi:hypothetical protein